MDRASHKKTIGDSQPSPSVEKDEGKKKKREKTKSAEKCLEELGEVLRKLHLEDQKYHTYRQALGLAQYIKMDLLPLVIHNSSDIERAPIIDTAVQILVNLTLPVECLISTKSTSAAISQSIYEIERHLLAAKESFLDPRVTRALLGRATRIIKEADDRSLSNEDCDSINNILLLFRNVLYIPETYGGSSFQNQLLWNLYTQGADRLLIELMTSQQRNSWALAMAQLIGLMYKDQDVRILQNLLVAWLDASPSESSDDNESNTTPKEQSSGDSSPMLTSSDPTSDSSDNGSSQQQLPPQACSKQASALSSGLIPKGQNISDRNIKFPLTFPKSLCTLRTRNSNLCPGNDGRKASTNSSNAEPSKNLTCPPKVVPPSSEMSDCGYVTQIENPESVSTSSNEGDRHLPQTRSGKARLPGKASAAVVVAAASAPRDLREMHRKKLNKRIRTNMRMKTLPHRTPTNEDISLILKEFTVDMLMRDAYGFLVRALYTRLLENTQTRFIIDTSYFFWLVTYFLKFSTQLDIDLIHIKPVLSYDIISYLAFEGTFLSEQLELWVVTNSSNQVSELKPCLRRMHLVVIAIKEFILAIEMYNRSHNLSELDRAHINNLQIQISLSQDIRKLFLLLIRQFNGLYQSVQYLQDLIMTNHHLLTLIDNCSRWHNLSSVFNLSKHLSQFATVHLMYQYGIVLDHYRENSQFLNECVFTMMHHVAGDLKKTECLFQSHILSTFSSIWDDNTFQICQDWADLIEYVIRKLLTPNFPSLEMYVGEELTTQRKSSKECPGSSSVVEEQQKPNQDNADATFIQELSGLLTLEEKAHILLWLRNSLLEACYVKFYLQSPHPENSYQVMESVPYHFTLLEQSIPLVPWNRLLWKALTNKEFISILYQLGIQLHFDTNKIFPRIPHFWTADYILNRVEILGPIPSSEKFDSCFIAKVRHMKSKRENHGATASASSNIVDQS